MISGHTKFKCDSSFGLIKKLYRKTTVDCVDHIIEVIKKSRYRKNKPVTLFSKTCSIELPASFLIYTLLKKLLAFKIALFLYDRPIFETHKITCTF